MAAAHSTSKSRSGRNRAGRYRIRTSERRRSAKSAIDQQALRESLESHARTLRNAMFVAITCCDAMCQQNADGEVEVATVLRVYCGNTLYRAIQETGMLLALLDGKSDVDPESEEITSLADPEGRCSR
jgi:hypothetical protein